MTLNVSLLLCRQSYAYCDQTAEAKTTSLHSLVKLKTTQNNRTFLAVVQCLFFLFFSLLENLFNNLLAENFLHSHRLFSHFFPKKLMYLILTCNSIE